MSIIDPIRARISPQNPFLLMYHKLLGVLAALWHGFPANRLKVIAVTGTKGKSTTVHLLANILKSAGHKVGLASTIHFQIGDKIWPNETKQTTQGRFKLQGLLREMVKEHCEYVILEATSHALVQSRLWGINVDAAILTNIDRDHIEYHGGFENYLRAKGMLFAMLVRSERKFGMQKTAVLPVEDPNFAYFDSFPSDKKVTYGLGQGMVYAADLSLGAASSSFTLKAPNAGITIDLKIPGEFNIKNALAAAACALSLGINLNTIKKGLEIDTEIPGRLESVQAGQPFAVIVDYAHTPDSLQKLFSLFKPLTVGRLFAVFGATGGGRDKAKRPEMGAVADKYADVVILTDDDSYTEDRMQIIDQIAEGVNRKEGENFWRVRDRRQAIRLALAMAQKGDTVIIAGKGCEPVQIVDGRRIEWDDRAVARDILSRSVKVEL